MRILCVVNRVFVPGAGERKEDTHHALGRIHSRISSEVSLLSANTKEAGNTRSLSAEELGQIASAMGGVEIVPVKDISLWSLFGYLRVLGGVKIRAIPRLFRLVLGHRRELSAADEYIKKGVAPDVITAFHSVENSGILAYLIGRKHNIPYIVIERRTGYQRGLMEGARGDIAKKVLSSANLVLGLSPQHIQGIQDAMRLEKYNFKVLPVAISDHFFEPPLVTASWITDFAKGRFVFAGWTDWRDIKRPDIALAAFQKLQSEEPGVCMILAGPVPEWVQGRVQGLGLSKEILLPGSLNRKEIKELAHGCDCCIVPSDHETLAVPVMESMAAGNPVVATRCGGPESILTDSKLGILTEKGNSDSFAGAMLDVLRKYDTYKPRDIAQHCERLYGESAMEKEWRQIYDDAL